MNGREFFEKHEEYVIEAAKEHTKGELFLVRFPEWFLLRIKGKEDEFLIDASAHGGPTLHIKIDFKTGECHYADTSFLFRWSPLGTLRRAEEFPRPA